MNRILLILLMIACQSLTGIFTGMDTPGGSMNHTDHGWEGTWYEQDPYGGSVEIDDTTIAYYGLNYSTETSYSAVSSGGTTELVPEEEYWYFCDIFYDEKEDVLTMHDLPHTDGDGGYHLITFLRTEYVAPPEPVYGERHDNSDPDARKEFEDYSIRSLSLDLYEPGVDSGDMAEPEPRRGVYSYELSVDENGEAVICSDFCREVSFAAERLQMLQEYLRDQDMGQLNGIDIWTEDMPEQTQQYMLDITFSDGESLISRANGKDIPTVWYTSGRGLHELLFEAFTEAGYNPSTGEFHTTEPLMRIGSEGDAPASFHVTSEDVRIEKTGTAYDYSVHADYPVFSFTNVSGPLQRSLEKLSAEYHEQAEQDVQENDALMAAVPESVWKEHDWRYMYSFYSVERIREEESFLHFWITEGHASSFGLGEYEYGYYPYWRCAWDTATGEELSVNDFFVDEEELRAAVTELLCEYYNDDSEAFQIYTSEEYQQKLQEGLSTPEREGGIGLSPEYNGLTLFFPEEYSWDGSYDFSETLYYDQIQQILNERYACVW